jgi:hypothetical protein
VNGAKRGPNTLNPVCSCTLSDRCVAGAICNSRCPHCDDVPECFSDVPYEAPSASISIVKEPL